MTIKKKCLNCLQEFDTTKSGLYHSHACGVAYRRKRARNQAILSDAVTAVRDERRAYKAGRTDMAIYDLLTLYDAVGDLLADIEEFKESKRKRKRK